MTTTKIERKYSVSNVSLGILSILGFPGLIALIMVATIDKYNPEDIIAHNILLYNTFLWGGLLAIMLSLICILILVSRNSLDNYEDSKKSAKKKKTPKKGEVMSYFAPETQIRILTEFVDFVDRPEFCVSLELKVGGKTEKITMYEPIIRGIIKKVLTDRITGYERMESRSSTIPEQNIAL